MTDSNRIQNNRTRRSVLQSVKRLSLVSASAVVFSGTGSAWNWTSIDIKVGSDPNSINLNGTVPVSVLSSEDFHPAKKIDLSNATVRFGIYWGPYHLSDDYIFDNGDDPNHGNGHVEDVNNDGIDDLTFHFGACDSLVDEVHENDMRARLLIKGDDGSWKGDEPVRIVGGSCD